MKRPQKLERRGNRNAALPPGAEIARAISARSPGVTHSSASSDSTHSPRARSRARFFWRPKPGQSEVWCSRAPASRQMSAVRSALPCSTTTISSAQATDSRQRRIVLSAFFAMMMADRLKWRP